MKVIKRALRRALKNAGYETYNTRLPNIYSEDGLSTGHAHSFIHDPDFQAAYARARQAIDGKDHNMRWRAHVALWVAQQVSHLPGDFAECGVSRGFLTSAIMQRLGWNDMDKTFWLFDTFSGLDERYVSEGEAEDGRLKRFGDLNVDVVRRNFAEFERVEIVVGTVPETLEQADVDQVCYVSLDMNCTEPEIAAFDHFWPKLVPGGIVLMDDYAYSGYEEQHHAYNAHARKHGLNILNLPTGQGMIQKPA